MHSFCVVSLPAKDRQVGEETLVLPLKTVLLDSQNKCYQKKPKIFFIIHSCKKEMLMKYATRYMINAQVVISSYSSQDCFS